jgi:hypothetical protein
MSNRQQKYVVLGFILLMFFVLGGDCDINAVHFLVTDAGACGGTVSPQGKETKQGLWGCDPNQVFSVRLFPCACRSMDVIARSPEVVINSISGTAISFQRVRGDQNTWFVEVTFYPGVDGKYLLTPDPSCIQSITPTPTPPEPASWEPDLTPTPTPTPLVKPKPKPTPTPTPCITPVPYMCPATSSCKSSCPGPGGSPAACPGYPLNPTGPPGVCNACPPATPFWCNSSTPPSCVASCGPCPDNIDPTAPPWECLGF